jgi:hypothetical protein
VRESDDLRSVIQVQIRLFRRYPIEMGRVDLGEHIGKDLGIGFESHDAGVEIEREPSVVGKDVRGCGEDEREFEEFVKVPSDVGVGVEVDGGLDPDGVERPDPQLCILVDESGPDTLSVIRRFYQIDRVKFPAKLFEVTLGGFGYSFGEIDHDLSRVGVDFCEGVSKGGYSDGV